MKRFFKQYTLRSYTVAVFAVAVLTSALLTTLSILDDCYRALHFFYAVQTKDPVGVPDNAYTVLKRVMSFAAFIVPAIATTGFSASCFRLGDGKPAHRYLRALGFSLLIFPQICLQFLPLSVYQARVVPGYWQHHEFIVGLVLLSVYCTLVVLLSLFINGVIWFRER